MSVLFPLRRLVVTTFVLVIRIITFHFCHVISSSLVTCGLCYSVAFFCSFAWFELLLSAWLLLLNSVVGFLGTNIEVS